MVLRARPAYATEICLKDPGKEEMMERGRRWKRKREGGRKERIRGEGG